MAGRAGPHDCEIVSFLDGGWTPVCSCGWEGHLHPMSDEAVNEWEDHCDRQVGARYTTYENEIERLRTVATEAIDLADDLQRTHPDPYDSHYRVEQLRKQVVTW